MTLNLPVTSLM